MRIEIKRIQQQLGITTVFVTHDQEECFSISDKVAIMNNGVIEQYDSPETVLKTFSLSKKWKPVIIGHKQIK